MTLPEANYLAASILSTQGFGALALATRSRVAQYHCVFLLFWSLAWTATSIGWLTTFEMPQGQWPVLALDVIQIFFLFLASYTLERGNNFAWADRNLATAFAVLPMVVLLIMLNGVLLPPAPDAKPGLWRMIYLGLHISVSMLVLGALGWRLRQELDTVSLRFVALTVFLIFALYALLQIPDYVLIILDPADSRSARNVETVPSSSTRNAE